jgi:hypothetical protein
MLRFERALIASIAVLLAASITASWAQTTPPTSSAPRVLRARPRIEVTPRPLLYRRCIDWLELQYRPSGPVLYPQYHCWWVRG